MSSPVAGPILPAAASAETGSPPVDNPPAPAVPPGWRDRLTDADLPVLVAVLREHHARRRPLHAEALDLQHRLTEGTPDA